MRYLLLASLLLFFVGADFINLVPQLTCWFEVFPRVNQQRDLRLVLGYNNTGITDVTLAITLIETLLGPNNVILPLAYNGPQPLIYLPGSFPFAVTVQDTLHRLDAGQTIQWFLGRQSVSINVNLLVELNRCLQSLSHSLSRLDPSLLRGRQLL